MSVAAISPLSTPLPRGKSTVAARPSPTWRLQKQGQDQLYLPWWGLGPTAPHPSLSRTTLTAPDHHLNQGTTMQSPTTASATKPV